MIGSDLGDPYEYIRQVFSDAIKAIVDNADEVSVELCQETKTLVVRVSPADLPKLTKSEFNTVRSLRSLLIAATKSLFQEEYVLDLKPWESSATMPSNVDPAI